MSLIRAAIRLCTVMALKGKTFAQARVYDSDNKPLIEVLEVDPKPFVLVYTEGDASNDTVGEFGLYSTTRAMTIAFEIGQAGAAYADDGQKFSSRLNIPHTDAGMELGLDFLQAQVIAAFYGDARSEWAELNRLMILRILKTSSMRGGSAKKGGHWAARQFSVTCDVISDPTPGDVPLSSDHPLSRFIALAKAANDPYITPSVVLLETFMGMYPYGDSYADWEIAQQKLGLTRRAVRGIGIAPLSDTLGGSSPYATEDGTSIVTSEDNEASIATRIVLDNEDESGTDNDVADSNAEAEPHDPGDGFPRWPEA